MLQDSLKLIILGNVLILLFCKSFDKLWLHFILKYCIVGYIIACIYSFQVHPVAFDYWRVRWLWIHTSTLWLDLQSITTSVWRPRSRHLVKAQKSMKDIVKIVIWVTRIRFLRLFTLWFERKQRIRVTQLTQNSVRSYVQRIFSKMALCWRRGD